MKVVQKKVWVTVLTCKHCGRKKELWHGQKKPTKTDYPSCGEHDGWDIKNEICTICRIGKNWFE